MKSGDRVRGGTSRVGRPDCSSKGQTGRPDRFERVVGQHRFLMTPGFSDLVGAPPATARSWAKIFCPTSSNAAFPSRTRPASASMSAAMRRKVSGLAHTLIKGRWPIDHRAEPVGKKVRCAPPAILWHSSSGVRQTKERPPSLRLFPLASGRNHTNTLSSSAIRRRLPSRSAPIFLRMSELQRDSSLASCCARSRLVLFSSSIRRRTSASVSAEARVVI